MRSRISTSLRGSLARPVRQTSRAVAPLTLSVAMTLTIPGLAQAQPKPEPNTLAALVADVAEANQRLEVDKARLEQQVAQGGASAGLVTGEAHLIGQLEECVVCVTAADDHPASRLAVRVEQENGRWLVEDLAARAGAAGDRMGLKVNGREAFFAHVRDGDLLELIDGLLLRFRVR